MKRHRLPSASRVALATLILLSLLLPPEATDVALAYGTDIPEPLSKESTYRMYVDSEVADKGYTLIAPYLEDEVTLIDDDGAVVHKWSSDRSTMGTALLLKDGTLLRGRSGTCAQHNGVHRLDWDGTVLWDYTPPDEFIWHHDVEPMPNGNILINTILVYTSKQAVEMGRNPSMTSHLFFAEPILEVKPNGTAGGDIVWMWNPMDHLVQDYDPEKANYGVVKDHPELIDINHPWGNEADWQHSNSVSFNPELDQVMITNRNLDEIWVIDHNTTKAEAAGHTGGAHGRGGDLLYRWGNPQAYDAGNGSGHILYGPHDAHWIKPGLPGEGNILIFNNGINSIESRPEGWYSTVEEVVPPINATGGYDLVQGSAYGPSDSVWRYNASPPESFFAATMAGAQRLPNGNTLVCGGSSGKNREVTPDNEVVWEYNLCTMFQASRYYPPALDMDPVVNATEDTPLRIDVSPSISDPDTDHDDLTIDAVSPHAMVAGHDLLLLYPEEITSEVFNLSVSDGIFKLGMDVRVNITPANDPPLLAPVPDIAAIEDVPFLLRLRPVISDPDDAFEQMSITVDSPFVTVDGDSLSLLYPDGVLTDSFLLSVSDGELVDSAEVLVNVTPVNDPPTVDRIQRQEGVEDVPWTLDLGAYIRDIDSPVEGLSVESDSMYTSVSGLNLTLLYPEGMIMEVVFLTVSDGEDDTFARFNVTVEPVNDPPVIEDIPPLDIREDEPYVLDIGPAISDVDTLLEGLVLRVDSPYIEVGGLVLGLLYPNGVLHDEVTVEVWDADLHASTTLVIDVEPVNDPPAIADIPPLRINEDVPSSLDLGPYISDIDTPAEGLVLRVDSPFVTVVGHTLSIRYPDGVLHDELTIDVWDGHLNDSTTLVVDVGPVNDPPRWAPMPDLTAVEDVEGQFYLAPYFDDIDTPFGQLAVEASSSYGSLVDGNFIFIYPDGVLGETVTLTLTDGEFRVIHLLNVTVSPVNDAPELSGARVEPPEGGAVTSFRFIVVLRDVDMGPDAPVVVEVEVDGIRYRCSRDEPSGGPAEGTAAFLLEMELGPGTHMFRFTADDGDGGVATTETYMLTVDEIEGTTHLTSIMISSLIAGAAVPMAVAAFLMVRRRSSGPPA